VTFSKMVPSCHRCAAVRSLRAWYLTLVALCAPASVANRLITPAAHTVHRVLRIMTLSFKPAREHRFPIAFSTLLDMPMKSTDFHLDVSNASAPTGSAELPERTPSVHAARRTAEALPAHGLMCVRGFVTIRRARTSERTALTSAIQGFAHLSHELSGRERLVHERETTIDSGLMRDGLVGVA
jgi:hypothetical protein